MTLGTIIWLVGIVAMFGSFIVVLGGVWLYVMAGERKAQPAKAPAAANRNYAKAA